MLSFVKREDRSYKRYYEPRDYITEITDCNKHSKDDFVKVSDSPFEVPGVIDGNGNAQMSWLYECKYCGKQLYEYLNSTQLELIYQKQTDQLGQAVLC